MKRKALPEAEKGYTPLTMLALAKALPVNRSDFGLTWTGFTAVREGKPEDLPAALMEVLLKIEEPSGAKSVSKLSEELHGLVLGATGSQVGARACAEHWNGFWGEPGSLAVSCMQDEGAKGQEAEAWKVAREKMEQSDSVAFRSAFMARSVHELGAQARELIKRMPNATPSDLKKSLSRWTRCAALLGGDSSRMLASACQVMIKLGGEAPGWSGEAGAWPLSEANARAVGQVVGDAYAEAWLARTVPTAKGSKLRDWAEEASKVGDGADMVVQEAAQRLGVFSGMLRPSVRSVKAQSHGYHAVHAIRRREEFGPQGDYGVVLGLGLGLPDASTAFGREEALNTLSAFRGEVASCPMRADSSWGSRPSEAGRWLAEVQARMMRRGGSSDLIAARCLGSYWSEAGDWAAGVMTQGLEVNSRKDWVEIMTRAKQGAGFDARAASLRAVDVALEQINSKTIQTQQVMERFSLVATIACTNMSQLETACAELAFKAPIAVRAWNRAASGEAAELSEGGRIALRSALQVVELKGKCGSLPLVQAFDRGVAETRGLATGVEKVKTKAVVAMTMKASGNFEEFGRRVHRRAKAEKRDQMQAAVPAGQVKGWQPRRMEN